MAKIKTVTYTLPAFWACPLINDDESGLEDSESAELAAWLENEKPGACVGVSETPFFTAWHDAQGFALAGDCLEFIFQKG